MNWIVCNLSGSFCFQSTVKAGLERQLLSLPRILREILLYDGDDRETVENSAGLPLKTKQRKNRF